MGNLDSGGAPNRDYSGPLLCGEATGAATPMRRLSRVEYDYVIEDLLGIDSRHAAAFPADDSTIGFEVGVTVSDRLARDYLGAGEAIAREVVGTENRPADLEDLDAALARCAADLPDGTTADACAADFVRRFGRRAYRRPLVDEEITALVELFRTGRELADFNTGVQLVLNAILVSPNFLYRFEDTPDGAAVGDVVDIRDYELASRLSFYLWRSMPDDVLLDAAEAGELRTAEDVEAQARRMMDDARFSRSYEDFFRQWLGLDRLANLEKDPALYDAWNPALRTSLGHSLNAFLASTVESGSVEDLLLGGYAFVDEPTAALLGVSIPSGAPMREDGLVRVALPEGERAGLLTHPALLALLGKTNQSDPIHRGIFVRTRMLCEQLEPAPNDVDTTPPDLAPGLTTRERFDMHRDEPRCASCHNLIDPIGFGFENYDGIGRFRTFEEGHAIDASGMVNAGGDANGAFDGAIELSERLAESRTFHACMTSQMFRFASGRIETRSDGCSTTDLRARFEDSGWDLRELIVGITQTDDFLHREIAALPEAP